ncbi:MAG: portal protein [Cloacibacillus sp.]
MEDNGAVKRALERRRSNMLSVRQDWEPRWRQIQEVVAPIFGYFQECNRQGRRSWRALYNDTPLYAVQVLSAGLQSGLTSPNQQWYHLADPDPKVDELQEVRRYCIDCEEIMNADMLACGVYDAYAETYNNLGPYGTGGFLILEDDRRPFVCIPQETGEYCISQDFRGVINEFMRSLKMTPEQLVQRFGEKACPGNVLRAFRGDEAVEFNVHHLIAPNDGRIPVKLAGDFEFLSCYWLDEGFDVLEVGGHNELPFVGGRWYQVGRDVYGYGPGETAFGNAAQLQAMERDKTTARQLTVQPPMQVPTSMKDTFNMLPGSRVYYDPASASSAAPVQPVLNVQFDLNGAMQDIVVTEERIKRAFYTQLFMAILDRADQNPQKTATEIQEMIAEKSSMIGPVLQRLDREILRPSINRIYAIEARAGRLPEPPEVLVGRELSVQYTSPLMLALNTRRTASIEKYVGFIANVAQAKPEVLDLINIDKTMRSYANFIDVPPDCIYSEEEVEMTRQTRAQAQEEAQKQAQMMELLKTAPEAMKKMGDTPIMRADGTASNLLADVGAGMAEGMGGGA